MNIEYLKLNDCSRINCSLTMIKIGLGASPLVAGIVPAAHPQMAATMGAKRMVVSAMGVGAAAGCVGTWFEMSHGIVCIPVLTLPPFALSAQVATGSTVFGVAARQLLSAALYGLEPGNEVTTMESLEEVIDVGAAAGLSAIGTVTALWGAALTRRATPRQLRKINGTFLCLVSAFLQWREKEARALSDKPEPEGPEPPPEELDAQQMRQAQMPKPASLNLREDWQRIVALGAASGAVLGFIGVGPAWLLAPALAHTSPARSGTAAAMPQGVATAALGDVGDSAPSIFDERLRRTCTIAMVPPSIAAAWRHFSLGNAPNAGLVAMPLAAGAIFGSAVAGQQLEDVPCDEEFKLGVSGLLFAYGCWSIFRE